jgi:hypothetical protein
MNDGVKMLLERMETNPEEFVGRGKRWDYILEEYDNVLAEDEAKAIKEGLHKLRRAELTRAVMQEILKENTSPLQDLLKIKLSKSQAVALKAQADEIRAKHPFQPFTGEVE